jgi:D-lactate dehydrogenase (cytochrome)
MPGWSIHSRPPRGQSRAVAIGRDPDILRSFLEDAAHFPGGHASGLVVATSETDIADTLRLSPLFCRSAPNRRSPACATPMGEVLLSTSRLNHIVAIGADSVRVEAGVALADLLAALEEADRYYPPTPTFTGAFVGGTVATNAAGAATFKYGTTRDWVSAMTVVLPGGDVLDIERGATRAHPEGYIDIVLPDRIARLPVPRYRMPRLAKLSAGYFAGAEMDLIDLFIGSEGTLGVITEVTLRVLPRRPAMCLALVPFADRDAALSFARLLRDTARDTWRTGDPRGIDVSAIEHMDARCLALLREDGADRANGFDAAHATMALLVTIELPPGTGADQAYEDVGRARERARRIRRSADSAERSTPRACSRTSPSRRPAIVRAPNSCWPSARRCPTRSIDGSAAQNGRSTNGSKNSRRHDCAGRSPRRVSRDARPHLTRGLDAAIWGHISDGNLHPNVIPARWPTSNPGRQRFWSLGAKRSGSEARRWPNTASPQRGQTEASRGALRARRYDDMRRVKRALDPEWKLAPGGVRDRVIYSSKLGIKN